MRGDLRKDYDASIGQMRFHFGTNASAGFSRSSWKGPPRPEALFVDENACIGHSLFSLTLFVLQIRTFSRVLSISLVFDYHLLKILLQLSYNAAGCRECVHHASNTFVMDEATGCAQVKVQYGDSDQNIEVKIPLNRISTNRKYIEQNIYLFIWFIRGMVHKLSGFC